jgi:glutamine phosphoribosylpyrophosphate amidotransferase
MTLVYNEIIILNFLGFETNTKIEIVKRAKNDTEINQLIESDKLFNYNENEDF